MARSDQVKELIKLLDSDPGIAEKLLSVLKNPQAALNKSTGAAEPDIDPKVIAAITNGQMKVETGPTLAGVYQGVSVCATCGTERKTYSTNKDGLITQHICSKCENRMSFMTEEQRISYLKQGISNDYLSLTEAKFKVLQERFIRNRKIQAEKYKQFGREIGTVKDNSNTIDDNDVTDMPQIPFDVNPKGHVHDKDAEEIKKDKA